MPDQLDLSSLQGSMNLSGMEAGGGLDLSALTGANPLDYNATANTVDPNSLEAGVNRGIDRFQMNLYQSTAALADLVGENEIKQWGLEGAARNAKEMMKWGDPMRFKDVNSISDFGNFLVGAGSQLIPTALAYTAAAVGGSVLGGPVGGLAGVGAVSASQNVGEVKTALEDKGQEMGLAGWALAGGLTAIDTIGLGRLMSPYSMAVIKKAVGDYGAKEVAEKLIEGAVKGGMTKSIATQAVNGAITEAVASGISNGAMVAGTSMIADQDVNWGDTYDAMVEAAILGGTAGAGFGSVGGYVRYKNIKDFVSGKVADTSLEVQKNPGFFKSAWQKLTGDITAPMAAKLTQVPAGQAIMDIFKNRLENSHRDYRGKMFDSLSKVEQAAKLQYGREWKTKLPEDYNAGVNNPATAAVKEHYGWIAKTAAEKKLMSEEQMIDLYNPANMDRTRILNEWDKFVSELQKEGYDTVKNAETLSEYRMALEENNNFQTYRDAFRRLTDEDVATADNRSAAFKKLEEGNIIGKMGKERVNNRAPHLETSRIFPVSQKFYNTWSKGGNEGRFFWSNLQDYSFKAAHRFAGVDHLGKNGELLNREIIRTQEQLVNSEKPSRLAPHEIKRIYQMVDAFEGQHGRIEDPRWKTISSLASTGVNVTLLPLVTLGSFVETMNIAMKTDLNTLVHATATVMGRAGYEVARKMMFMKPSEEYLSRATQMQQAGQSLAAAHNYVAARMTEGFDVNSFSQKLNTKFFKWSGLTLWTQALRNFGAEAMRIKLTEDINTLTNFSGTSAAERAALRIRELGLTVDEAKAMQPNKIVTPEDRAYVNSLYAKAINRFNRHVAMEPSFADRPLWMSDHKMWALSRLQGYPTMFTNTVLPMLGAKLTSGVPHAVVDGLFITGLTTMMGAMQLGLRDMVSGKDPYENKDIFDVVHYSVARNLGPRPIQMIDDTINAVFHGRSPVESAIGPVASQGGKALNLQARLLSGKLEFQDFLRELSYLTVPVAGSLKNWWED